MDGDEKEGMDMGNSLKMFENLINGLNNGDQLEESIFKKLVGFVTNLSNSKSF
jgi:hypothetical protein